MEDVINARATLHLNSTFSNKSTFKFIPVRIYELVNQREDKWAAINFKKGIAITSGNTWCSEFIFFVCQARLNLHVDHWNTLFDVVKQDCIQRLGKVRNSHLVTECVVNRMFFEIFSFSFDGFFNWNFVVNILLRAAFNAKVAKLEGVDGTF